MSFSETYGYRIFTRFLVIKNKKLRKLNVLELIEDVSSYIYGKMNNKTVYELHSLIKFTLLNKLFMNTIIKDLFHNILRKYGILYYKGRKFEIPTLRLMMLSASPRASYRAVQGFQTSARVVYSIFLHITSRKYEINGMC